MRTLTSRRCWQTLAIPANVFDDFVPYAWAHQVDQAQQRAHRLEDALTQAQQELDQLHEDVTRARATARYHHDQAAIAADRTARALAEARPGSHRTGRAEGHPHRQVHRVAAKCLRHRTSRVQRSRTVRPAAPEGEHNRWNPAADPPLAGLAP